MTKQPLLIVAAGGTGGHMFPAQALAEVMLRRGWRVRLSTDARGARFTGGFPHSVEIEQVSSATFSRSDGFGTARVPFVILGGIIASIIRMIRRRPTAVVGFGGYPTVPALTAAWLLRIPRIIHEQNGIMGRVNKLFSKRVNMVASGMKNLSLPQNVPNTFVGNPVRAAVLKRAASVYIAPGDYPMSILVIGGSQGARVLSDEVPAAIAGLPDEYMRYIRVSHQAREEDMDRVNAAYRHAGITADVMPFFNDIPRRMSEAQIVISRAGASSVADIAVIGRPSILVPLAIAIRDEQTANARTLVDAGAAILIGEKAFDAAVLREQIITILSNPQGANQMAQAALRCAVPDAPKRLADLIETLTEKGNK